METTIQIDSETREMIKALKVGGETYDQVIRRIIKGLKAE